MPNHTKLEPYIFFERTCAEAMEFYKSIFGGELETTTRGSIDPDAPDDMKDLLIHASLTGGMVDIMASDDTAAGTESSQRISLALSGEDEDALRKVFDQLAEGGEVRHPLKKEFWGDIHGNVVDKYNIIWMITIGNGGEEAQ